jgi:hypothetical protein
MSRKFLTQVVDYYKPVIISDDFAEYCFVLPNKRSAMFLKKYIQQAKDKTSFMPSIMTMGSFVSRFASHPEGLHREQLFTLYESYATVLKRLGREEQLKDFDRFIFWGEMMLSDFDDVDKSLVKASELFKNLRDYKSIQSNYLDEDQKKLVRTLWGESALTSAPVDEFWLHVPHSDNDEDVSSKFISLWEVLADVYAEFQQRMNEMDLSTRGHQTRTAYDYLKDCMAEDLPFKRIVFVGFSEPSMAELAIFKKLKDLDVADFFWDVASPILNVGREAGSSMQRRMWHYVSSFPMPEDFTLEKLTDKPDIEIIAIPSNVAQTKLVYDVLQEWIKEGVIDTDNPENTAIVLPDENLLLPLLMSLPEAIQAVNITMGVPYITTTFAALLRSVVSMQLRARQIRGSYHFYYEDVMQVLSNPYFNIIAVDDCDKIKEWIEKTKTFNIDAAVLTEQYPSLAYLFTAVKDLHDVKEVHQYTISLITNLCEALERIKIKEKKDARLMELDMLRYFESDLADLAKMIDKHGISMSENTYFHLFERLLSSTQINLTGMPLKGLQIMGVLETRNLDFDNVIVLSMNERIFPRKTYTKSMIPTNLRAGYMMMTQDEQEGAYAYHFARLISRAKRVKLVYDSRVSTGTTTGEASRYLTQLRYLYGSQAGNITYNTLDMPISYEEKQPIVINKSPQVMAELEGFKPGGKLRLSASALKTLKNCRLQFYLEYVKNLRGSQDIFDYITDAEYGSILHKVVEILYSPYKGREINADAIDKMLSGTVIADTIQRVMVEKYKELNVEATIIAGIIQGYITRMLQYEREGFCNPSYTFVDAEMGVAAKTWQITPDLAINFKMAIDRVDRLSADKLRFIDYKTGSDKITTKSISDLFTGDSQHGTDAIFQLLVYCEAYAAMTGFKGDIVPYIYPFMMMSANNGIVPITVGDKEITSYKEVSEEFMDNFVPLIESLFDDHTPFDQVQSNGDKRCAYCPFITMCGRNPSKF